MEGGEGLVGIVRMARTRGASPWLYGLAAGLGWLFMSFIAGLVVAAVFIALGYEPEDGRVLFGVQLGGGVGAWLWVGLVAVCVRYGVGRGAEGPSGSWSCQNCRLINQSSR
jgi:hypothetical protein